MFSLFFAEIKTVLILLGMAKYLLMLGFKSVLFTIIKTLLKSISGIFVFSCSILSFINLELQLLASNNSNTIAAFEVKAMLRSTPAASIGSLVFLNPAVSMNLNKTLFIIIVSSIYNLLLVPEYC